MSEHTDAARLEALRDSMRPRVEGEKCEGCGWWVKSTRPTADDVWLCGACWKATPTEGERMASGGWLTMTDQRWAELSKLCSLEMRDALAEAAAQRAEVERWREEVARAATALDLVCGSAGCESFGECEHANMLRAALALPTNAPGATDG